MFKMPSQESLDEAIGQTIDKRGSPELPVFNNGSPDRRIEQQRSGSGGSSGTRVKVLPTLKSEEVKLRPKSNSPPPIVKPKPSIPKKPQFLKQTPENSKQQSATSKQQQIPPETATVNEEEGERVKAKKVVEISQTVRIWTRE